MKKGLLLTTSLAMVLGVGVAVGAHHAESVKEAEAATNSVKIAGSFTNWGTGAISMELSGNYYVYTREFAANDEFKVVVNDSDWISANWNGVTNSTDGGIVDGGGGDHNFKVVTPAKYTVKAANNIGDYGEKGFGLTIEPYTEPDIPESDGYYIVGTESNWKYAGATKMSAGTDGNVAQLIQYEAKANEIFKVRSYNNGVDTWYGSNYEVGATAKTLNIYLNSSYEVYVSEYVKPDIPESEGYYICGEFSSNPCWTYEDAAQMISPSTVPGNVAHYMNMYLAIGDKLRVRSYYTDRDPYDQWAKLGNGEETYGHPSKSSEDPEEYDNFEFTAAGYYDIYAYYEEDTFKYYVAEHVDSYTIQMSAVLFEGKDKRSVQPLADQTAYSTEEFSPIIPDVAGGYISREVYVDEDCSTEYSPIKFGEGGHLYIKYTKTGYYVTGDATFSGSSELAWKVDGATYLPYAVNDTENNILEGSVTIPASASKEHPVSVKPLEYNGEWVGVTYDLGAEYDFCYMDKDNPDEASRSNLVFTKGGTFAVYVTKTLKVYLNEGLPAFNTKFLTDTGAVCKTDDTTNLERLQEVWADLENVYKSLSKDERDIVEAVGIDGGSDVDDLHKVVARYAYIVKKYGTATFKDFIFGGEYEAKANYIPSFDVSDNSAIIIIITVASVTMVSTGLLLFLKKRKTK